MQSIPALAALMPRALLFDGDAYLEMKRRPRAARDGVLLLAWLGSALGLAAVLTAIVSWTASPELPQVQQVLLRELPAVPIVRRLMADAPWLAGVTGMRWPWLAVLWLRPEPPLALLRLLWVPAGVFVGWLGFGLTAHVAASALGGHGELGLTLGCLALAEAPRILLLLPLLPPLGLAGIGVWAWVLAARFQAVRAAHGLDSWRAFWTVALALLFLGAAAALWLLAAVALGRLGLQGAGP